MEKGEGREGKGEEGGEGKFKGQEERREGKRGKEGKFRGARPPKYFFLEPRLGL